MSDKRLGLQNRFYDRIRSGAARRAAEGTPARGSFDALRGHKYGLVVTFKRDGTGVPTPVWFGLDEAGRLYFRTGADVAKVRRLRRDPRVLVAPCTVRGKPRGPSIEGTARLCGPEEKEHAEAAIQSNYGLGRRLYEGAADAVGGDEAYVEIAPREPALEAAGLTPTQKEDSR
jgi:PPOX class probable F420-dependent enzyme